ncbi:unnamed protein product [Brachionus calyciflorus]|uniref:Uncharacterized protein n=1 Tax=Brachionus calyciflorus TaxID=104777 RepID=A0A814IMI2_9BILA|nr:unnamed protein product [Brachionus calyciflorus]
MAKIIEFITIISINLTLIQNYEVNITCKNFKLIDKKPLIGIGYMAEVNIYFNHENGVDFNCLNLDSNRYILNFIPNMFMSLDNSFKFKSFKFEEKVLISFQFIKINTFELDSYFFTNLRDTFDIYLIRFYYSKFKVLTQKGNDCFLNKSDNFNFFGSLETLGFGFTTKYSKKTCPLLFANSQINSIEIYGLSDNFLLRNKLGFLRLNKTINSSIQEIVIKAYEIDLDETFLDRFVFDDVQSLELRGKIRKISVNQMKNLATIALKVESLKEFIFLNRQMFKNTLETNLKFIDIYNYNYQFPDEDFCIFKEFHSLYWLEIKITNIVYKCSCTILLLFKITKNNTRENELFSSICKSNKIDECKLEVRLSQCNLDSNTTIYESTSSDLILNSENLNFLTIFMTPISCLITIITNLINLKILYKINKEKRCKSIKLMILSSILNVIYSFIYSIHLINKCIYVNGIFCSAILREKPVQLFDIILVEFLLNVLKIWSNASIICLSWLRLSCLSKDKNWVKKLTKFQNTKIFKILISFLLGISVFVSLDKLFVVRVNEQFFIMEENDYEEFPNKNTFMFTAFRDIGDHSVSGVHYFGKKSVIFYVLFVANFILNDFILYSLLLFIDLYILYLFNQNIKRKNKLAMKLKTNGKQSTKNTESKVNSTVVLNLIIVFFLKFGHFGVSFYIFMNKLRNNNDYQNVCFNFSRSMFSAPSKVGN